MKLRYQYEDLDMNIAMALQQRSHVEGWGWDTDDTKAVPCWLLDYHSNLTAPYMVETDGQRRWVYYFSITHPHPQNDDSVDER